MIALVGKALIIACVGGGVPMVTLADNDINSSIGVAASKCVSFQIAETRGKRGQPEQFASMFVSTGGTLRYR